MNDDTTKLLPTVNARIYPRGGLDVLSRAEVARLRDASSGGMHDLLRRCALAVLTSGSSTDDPRAAQELYPDFDIQVLQQDRGVRIDLHHAPAIAFVDGEIIRGVAELLFAVVRDLAYTAIELNERDLDSGDAITDAVLAPRFDCQGDNIDCQTRIPEYVCAEVRKKHPITRLSRSHGGMGLIHAIALDPQTGRLTGAADTGADGMALRVPDNS